MANMAASCVTNNLNIFETKKKKKKKKKTCDGIHVYNSFYSFLAFRLLPLTGFDTAILRSVLRKPYIFQNS